jgi:uncharacterized protein YecE (DUF72 family)
MIKLGTSGFSYDDWIGPVYPQDLPRWKWLPFYAEQFNTVELNVTYYRLPSQKIAAGWVERTPDDFTFSVKAHRSLTHDRKEPNFQAYCASLAPLIEAGKLACVLAQFPHSFHNNPANRDYLLIVREGISDLPVVIEFRDNAWVTEETFELLEELRFGFCCVDEPQIKGLMPPVVRVTGSPAYVRFHGRNAERWWRHEHAWERYDYTYSDPELEEWIPHINTLDDAAPLTLVYANNHYRGQSVDTVRSLERLLAAEA